MATVRRLIGNIKGPQGEAATVSVGTVSTGEPGTSAVVTNSGTTSAATFNFTIPRGATGAAGAPGVTDYATTERAGLVRVGDDFEINSSNGTLSIKNLFTTASTLAKMVSEEAFATSLGKIAKAVDWVVDNAQNFFNKNTDIVDGFTSSLTNKALSANAGKTLKTQLDSLNDSLSLLNVVRYVMTLTKTVGANSYESVTLTASDLSLGSVDVIKMCNVHLKYYGSASSFQIGSEISYRLADDNRSVLIGIYNTTSAQRTYNIQCEVIANRTA